MVNIHNIREIYEEYVDTELLANLPTYQLSQDPLESFFGRIRNSLGTNTNPTVEQFKAAYRKNLLNLEIQSSIFSNCRDQLNILTVSSKKNDLADRFVISEIRDQIEFEFDFNPNDQLLDPFRETLIVSVAAEIESRIRKATYKCTPCAMVLVENNKISDDINICRHIH